MAGGDSASEQSLYDVLGVHREAAADEIRSAYRRLALQHHPDKAAAAGVAPEAATARFQSILNAYEVLSNPSARGAYDSRVRYRSLFPQPQPSPTSTAGAAGTTVSDVLGGIVPYFFNRTRDNAEDILNELFKYFSDTAYSGFSDTGKGFFKVYGDLFVKIFYRETAYSPEVQESPEMGNSESSHVQVSAFYAYWLGFSTVLDFAWEDVYHETDAMGSRKERRTAEEANKKARGKARREYMQTVRELAEFAKKRDPRVIAMAAKKRAELEEKKAKEKAWWAAEAAAKAERAQAYQEQDWTKTTEVYHEEEGSGDGEEEEEVQEYHCGVCKKKFKSEKQWENHERSKNHKDKVAGKVKKPASNIDEVKEENEGDEKKMGVLRMVKLKLILLLMTVGMMVLLWWRTISVICRQKMKSCIRYPSYRGRPSKALKTFKPPP